ncbi:serine hydrolase domain-containing protein [Dyella amyloliquefaciens]|uniref:serine hydrolase domain-containing protein n=1 Tax=Dyella amyloliquefaciens TaxID=1770545 RepID=UPI001E4C90C1|nr:serine hydrolase domain-containing protein [Dyella amyloliquefaciens]
MNLRSSVTSLLSMFMFTMATGVMGAQAPMPESATTPNVSGVTVPAPITPVPAGSLADLQGASTHQLTNEDLSAFLDGFVPIALARGDVAGGVVSVVKDGKVLFAKGYGYADLEKRTPVEVDRTSFRIGSTSKLFTWTAVMQLVEQGKLDLDADVNQYLDFKIPPYQGKPITLRNIMTHTPGFEDTAKNLISIDGKPVNLEQYMKSHLPERIFPAGEVVAYSNYGCGLAGYIVQRVSGQDFDDYVDQHIFIPLDMQHSTFRQPLPSALAPLMSESYKTASDGKQQAFEIISPAPAGAVTATALDMTHFMIAQLQNGLYGNNRILQQATAVAMHAQQRTEAPGLNGFALGFYHEDSHGQRIIGHAGDLDYFHTDLHLLLDSNVGIFMSFNSAGNAGGAHVIRTALFDAFLDRYYPTAPAKNLPTASTAKADAARVAGWYLASRRNDSGMRMMYALGQNQVQALPDGTIIAGGINNAAGTPLHWREIGPLQYQEVNGTHKLDFVADANGNIDYWATDAVVPVMIFQRLNGLHALGSIKLLGALGLLVTLLALLVWFGGWLVRRHYRRTLELPPQLLRSRLWSRLATLVLFGTLVGWLILLICMGSNPYLLLQGTAVPWMYLLSVLGVVALIGVLLIVIHTTRCWMAKRSRWVLLGETVLAFFAVYLAWLIVAFGMVSFNVRF